jgi:endonuclease/exonuclease/phosphatase family metal-dependent hydrolase
MLEKGILLRPVSLSLFVATIFCTIFPDLLQFIRYKHSLIGISLLSIVYIVYNQLFSFRKSIGLDSTRSHVSPNKGHIRLLTYNIFLRPPFIRNNADDYKNERFEEFLNHLDNYDVIALQEMFSLANSRQKRLLDVAYQKGFHYTVKSLPPPLFSKKFIDAGLVILSRCPIVESGGHIYNSGSQIDSWAAKQVIYAKIKTGENKFFYLFTTHMQASYNDNSPQQNVINDQARIDQVAEMSQFIKKVTRVNPWPVLIAGDLNIDAKEQRHCNVTRSDEYSALFQLLNTTDLVVTDLLHESYGHHPSTYGDAYLCSVNETWRPKETVLTAPVDHCTKMCIDYLVLLRPQDEDQARKLRILDNSTKVEEFCVLGKPYSHLSDHYGISTALDVSV